MGGGRGGGFFPCSNSRPYGDRVAPEDSRTELTLLTGTGSSLARWILHPGAGMMQPLSVLIFAVLLALLHRPTSSTEPEPSEGCLLPPVSGLLSRAPAPAALVDEVLESSQEALLVTERRYLRLDWCKTQPLKQSLQEEGCLSRTILNRFCYGQCSSFYIPRHAHQEAFQSCSACRPKSFSTVTYTLLCPGQTPGTRKKRVQRVKQCRCATVKAA